MEEEQRKGMHIIIFTRALGRRARAYAQGKGRGNTGKLKKIRKGNQNGNPKRRRQEEGEIVAREENTKKRVETGVF